MGLRVEEDCLPRGMNGYYCDALGLIVLHDKLNARQRLCTLQHELIHGHPTRWPRVNQLFGLLPDRKSVV